MHDRFQIAGRLREVATLLRVHGEDPFRARAYEGAADALELAKEDLDVLVRERRLTDLPGIGRALAAAIVSLRDTGTTALLDQLRRGVPTGIAELLEIPELGPKKILALHQKLGIETVEDLHRACEAGVVRAVKGFGAKTEERIRSGIERLRAREPGHLLLDALDLGDRLLAYLREAPRLIDAAVVGSTRRRKEVVEDVGLVAAADDAAPVLEHFLRYPGIVRVVAEGPDRCRARLLGVVDAELTVVPPAAYASALLAETGSAPHVEKLRAIAAEQGLDLAGGSEPEIYRRLGMQYVPPELREDQGEVESALAGTLPEDLVTDTDLRGFVHCHTDYSDGRNTIEEMARAAEAMGMRYLTITDHSPTAGYAGGLSVERLERQWEEIARVQEKVGVRLLRGTESDILADGSLDYPDAILERFDIVIASIHARGKMDAEEMTRRLVRTMRLPVFKIWGHALGRMLRKRPAFECRVEEVLDAAAEGRAAIEINGDPHRLDLEPRWVREARERGIRFVLSADAHSVEGLRNLRFAVAMARRGWVRRGEVLNTLAADAFAAAVRPAA